MYINIKYKIYIYNKYNICIYIYVHTQFCFTRLQSSILRLVLEPRPDPQAHFEMVGLVVRLQG